TTNSSSAASALSSLIAASRSGPASEGELALHERRHRGHDDEGDRDGARQQDGVLGGLGQTALVMGGGTDQLQPEADDVLGDHVLVPSRCSYFGCLRASNFFVHRLVTSPTTSAPAG